MPTRPCPPVAGGDGHGRVHHLDADCIRRRAPDATTACFSLPCFRAFVSASWTIRYAVRPIPEAARAPSRQLSTSTSSPRRAQLLQQRWQLVEVRLRGQVVAAGERISPSMRRSSTRASRPTSWTARSAAGAASGSLGEHAFGGSRLHHHDAHAVRDHVVHLARDPRAFVVPRLPRLLLLLDLERTVRANSSSARCCRERIARPDTQDPATKARMNEVVGEVVGGARDEQHLGRHGRDQAADGRPTPVCGGAQRTPPPAR